MATKKVNIDIVAKDRSQQALAKVRGSLDKVKQSVFNVRNALVGLGGGLVIKSLVNTGKEIENLQVRLKFLFGSTEEGAKAFDEMAKFASKVPFSLEEIQQGAGVLSVVAKDADELSHILKITGNVAAVTGLDFRTASEQIQRSLSAGIGAADLFREKGVNAMLGFKAGAKVTIEETAEAFERVFGKGGKFDGATDELANTFEGTLSMIGDKFFNFKRTILDAGFFPELKKQFGDFDKFLEDNQKTLDEIAVTIGRGLALAVQKLADGLIFVTTHFDKFVFAIKLIIALKVAKVFMGIATAVMNVAKATVLLAAGTQAIKKGLVGIAMAIGTGGVMFVAFQQMSDLFDSFLTDLDKMGSGQGFDSLGAQLNKMGINAKKTKDSLEQVNVETIKTFDILTSAREKLERNDKTFDRIKQRQMSEIDLIRKRQDDEIAIVNESIRQLAIIRDESIARGLMSETMANQLFAQKVKDLEALKNDIMLEGSQARLKIIKQEADEAFAIMQKNYDEQFNIIRTGNFAQLDLTKLSKDQQVQLTKDAGRELISQLAQTNKAMFFLDKALRIRQAIMNTSAGVTRALATGNIPLAFIIGGLGAVQIATIARQQFQGRRFGGSVSRDKPFMVGEAGPELFVPNQQGTIVPNNKMGGQPVTVNFNINTVDAKGFNELLVNSRGVIVNMINSAVNEKGRTAIV